MSSVQDSLSPSALLFDLAQSSMSSCPEGAASPAPVPRLSSRALLAGQREVEIDHEGTIYRLRQTALGKLILTK